MGFPNPNPNPNPDPGFSQYDFLNGVSAVSSSDAWAVGFTYNTAMSGEQVLILHWDGTSWRRVPSHNRPVAAYELSDVKALSASDVWAVGTVRYFGPRPDGSLILHWDGVRWTRVPSPSPGPMGTSLSGVDAVSATDAWAVGSSYKGRPDPYERAIALQWDGATWSKMPSSLSTRRSDLRDVTAVSATDVWAVGSSLRTPLIQHWDGATWTRASNLAPGNHLEAVDALNASDAWAVGEVVKRWDGTTWKSMPFPDPAAPGE